MHVFVTGATGWVGSVVVEDLLAAGHRVSGTARSEEKATALRARGATAVIADLDDPDRLATAATAATAADAVIHTAFDHDFSRFAESAAQDARVIEAFGKALAGTAKPLLVTSGVALIAPGRVATEADGPTESSAMPRRSENTARRLAAQGVRAATVRLAPSVHGVGETHGFVPLLIDLARRTGVSAFLGDGGNRWPAVHRDDAARVYRLALESGLPLPAYHAVGEEGVPFRAIAETLGRRLDLPVEERGEEHFGWFAKFAGADMAAASQRTRDVLGWQPTGPELLVDIDDPGYYGA